MLYCRVQITGYEILLFSSVCVAQFDFSREYRAKYTLRSIDCRIAVVHYIIIILFFLNNKNIHFIFQKLKLIWLNINKIATKELSINQIVCASLEELKDYDITKGITLPYSATKPIIQDLLITVCSKSDETQILQAKMQLLAAEQDALTRKLAAENQARIDETEALERKLAAER